MLITSFYQQTQIESDKNQISFVMESALLCQIKWGTRGMSNSKIQTNYDKTYSYFEQSIDFLL